MEQPVVGVLCATQFHRSSDEEGPVTTATGHISTKSSCPSLLVLFSDALDPDNDNVCQLVVRQEGIMGELLIYRAASSPRKVSSMTTLHRPCISVHSLLLLWIWCRSCHSSYCPDYPVVPLPTSKCWAHCGGLAIDRQSILQLPSQDQLSKHRNTRRG
ncbi:hypothetical protein K461DRAFT_278516 [Myriangium duriaei CBS 260.36]|uniref:Uncharacterized protein n=1 Tax=Myriangium duriaei CBS 260.36 TaxID=1168546 RepID=A0A9P4J1C6_9PEZI|nr:hypothetical protein K461DRAFT_278516 [Myriangium duriaei CBS 260.36]